MVRVSRYRGYSRLWIHNAPGSYGRGMPHKRNPKGGACPCLRVSPVRRRIVDPGAKPPSVALYHSPRETQLFKQVRRGLRRRRAPACGQVRGQAARRAGVLPRVPPGLRARPGHPDIPPHCSPHKLCWFGVRLLRSNAQSASRPIRTIQFRAQVVIQASPSI